MTIPIGFLAFPGMDLLSFAGPYQVFATATALADGPDAQFELLTISVSLEPVRADGGATLQPQATNTDTPPLACLVIPGGRAATDALIERGEVVAWLRDQSVVVPIIASVCSGAFVLAQTGLLNGLMATTDAEYADDLRRRFPDVEVHESRRWVDQGRLVTAAGPSAGVDMALRLVERLASQQLSVAVARRLEL